MDKNNQCPERVGEGITIVMRDVKPLQKGLAYLNKNLKIDESVFQGRILQSWQESRNCCRAP